MKAVSFGRDGSERCRPGLQVEGNEEAWPQPVPGTEAWPQPVPLWVGACCTTEVLHDSCYRALLAS